jgi:hypothetical protein
MNDSKPISPAQPAAAPAPVSSGPAPSPATPATPALAIPTDTAAASPFPGGTNLASLKEKFKTIADPFLDPAFRIGFGGVFLINSVTAIVAPKSFLALIQSNMIGHFIGFYPFQIALIAMNDCILGILIISGYKKRYVYAWAGLWLLIVTFFKSTSLL